jgi:conserved oligomeric Golgi complex subunit 4
LVCRQLTNLSIASSPLYYITALTALFEDIAMIVDQHHPVVEKYYGPGKMACVIARLLEECDRVVKGVVENWEEERSMKRKVATRSIPTSFTYLYPFQLSQISASTFGPSSINRRPPSQKDSMDEDQIDPREIDKLLSEVATMCGRWALFRKFLAEGLQVRAPLTKIPSPLNQQRAEWIRECE